jgi:hypothetical protein
MARRFMARTVHGSITESDLPSIDYLTRAANPIPADALMIWDPGTRTVRWEWDDGVPYEEDEQ